MSILHDIARSVVSGLSTRLPVMKRMERTILGLANLQCRWRRPTKIGDTLHVVLEVVEKVAGAKSDRGTIVLRRTAISQRGETVMERDLGLILRRQAPLAA